MATSVTSICLQGAPHVPIFVGSARVTKVTKMDGKIVVTSHPGFGYYYDIQTGDKIVSAIPDLGVTRRSVFDEVKTPAYK